MAERILKFPSNILQDHPVIQFSCKPYKTGDTNKDSKKSTVTNAQQSSTGKVGAGATDTFPDIDI